MSQPPDIAAAEGIVLELRGGRRVRVRRIRESDAAALQQAFVGLSAEARYTRFMAPLKELPQAMLERAVHPEPGREFALVAVAGEGPDETIVGGARAVLEADGQTCEFAVVVADDWSGRGLASRMLRELVGVAKAVGLKWMVGYVLATNTAMLALAKRLGFEIGPSEEGPTVRVVRLDLQPPGITSPA